MAEDTNTQGGGLRLLAGFLDLASGRKDVRPAHIALFAHILSVCGTPGVNAGEGTPLDTALAMTRSRVTNRRTYFRLLDDLVRWGWVLDLGRSGRRCRSVFPCSEEDMAGIAAMMDAEAFLKPSEAVLEAAEADCPQEAPDAPEGRETALEGQQHEQEPDWAKMPKRGMEMFDHLFGCWSRNVRQFDKRWVDSMRRDTGIEDYDLAMALYKEHIIRNAKVDAWMEMDLYEKKSYFINSSRFFATPECKTVKEEVARVVSIGGRPYVEQYGMRIALPSNYAPQPDVNYYWDEMWHNWRLA